MIELKADILICNIVDKFLDRKIISFSEDYSKVITPGILIELNCNVSDYSDDMNINIWRRMWFLFTGNTSVFVADVSAKERCSWRNIPLDDWKNTSNHDSCWRSDGMHPLSEKYFSMCDEVNAIRVSQGLKKLAPIKMSGFNTLGTSLFTNVRVTTTSDGDSYFRKVVSIEEC